MDIRHCYFVRTNPWEDRKLRGKLPCNCAKLFVEFELLENRQSDRVRWKWEIALSAKARGTPRYIVKGTMGGSYDRETIIAAGRMALEEFATRGFEVSESIEAEPTFTAG